MKKKIIPVLAICLAASTILLAMLWRSAENSKDDVRLLAQASAAEAYTHFVAYQTHGQTSSYWYGVAEFRSFENAYHLLTEGTNKATNYVFCNEVYGHLVLSPEKSQLHISEIVEVMEILSLDVEDENGYLRMADLRNNIQE